MNFTLLALFVLILVIVILRKQGLKRSKNIALQKGQRLRPIQMEIIEPLVELLVIGALLWTDMTTNSLHLWAASIGLIPGVLIGLYRAKIMYVRAEPKQGGVVLTRSTAEYIALALLLVVKVIAEYSGNTSGIINVIITGLLALVVIESITRAAVITIRYYKDKKISPTN